MARSYTKNQHGMQGAFIFVLLGLFALMSTLMVLLGAQMYRATVDKSQLNNQERLISAYVRSMVRAQDGGDVSVEEVDGQKVLCLREASDFGDMYVTRIYEYDGYLRENYTSENYDFELDKGEKVTEAQSFDASIEGQLLTVNMKDAEGNPCKVQVALHCPI